MTTNISQFKRVDKYLYRGGKPSVCEVFQLKNKGVTQIYDFRHKSMRGMKFLEKLACRIAGIKYTRMPSSFLYNDTFDLNDFQKIARSIKLNGEKGGKTFIHCNSGLHRTSQVAAFYEVTKGDSLRKCRRKKPNQYRERVENAIQTQIVDANFFNRKLEPNNSLNPITWLRTDFNNRVVVATRKAHENFVKMFEKRNKK